MKSSALFTIDDFRDEMRRRGVYKRNMRLIFSEERERRRNKIVTGVPRIIDKTTKEMQRRQDHKALADAVVRSARARLEVLARADRHRTMDCPWNLVRCCGKRCRCKGIGKVTAGFMISHYERMLAEYQSWL